MLDKSELTNKIVERLQSFEGERIKRLSKLLIREFFVFILLFILIKCFLICSYDFDAAFWFGIMILCAVYYSFYDITHTNKLFKNYIKEKCSNIIKNNLVFNGSTITKGTVKKSNLFGYFEDVNVDDGFQGSYNSVGYRILEASLIGKSSKGFDIQVYKGLIVLFEFNKKILKDTIIARKGDDCIRQNLYGLDIKRIMLPFSLIIGAIIIMLTLGGGSVHGYFSTFILVCAMILPGFLLVTAVFILPLFILHIIQQRKDKMENTKMEDIVFNKNYVVHTKDKVEARYLITTAFIDRYLKLQKIFKTKNIKCSFFGDQIMIAIPTKKDFFELGSLFLPLSNTTYIERFYEEITEILKVIDILKLNEKTGL